MCPIPTYCGFISKNSAKIHTTLFFWKFAYQTGNETDLLRWNKPYILLMNYSRSAITYISQFIGIFIRGVSIVRLC